MCCTLVLQIQQKMENFNRLSKIHNLSEMQMVQNICWKKFCAGWHSFTYGLAETRFLCYSFLVSLFAGHCSRCSKSNGGRMVDRETFQFPQEHRPADDLGSSVIYDDPDLFRAQGSPRRCLLEICPKRCPKR